MSLDDQPRGTFSNYTEFLAPAALADRFFCFWTQTISGSLGAYEHRVLPDACIDIVLINDEQPTVVGPWDLPFVARLAPGTCITGARLRPGHASCLLGMPASELLNQTISITAIKGAIGSLRFQEVIESPNAATRRSALAQALSTSAVPAAPLDQAVLASIRWLSSRPHGRIGQLSRWIGISERQLHRRFSAAVGYGPKMFQSVLRFQRLLKTARETGAERSLTDLAASAGYADQAHMTREVQRLSNLRPTVLLRSTDSTLQMSDLFKTQSSTRTIV
jgi:AraC-like DNA-binding protein